jgi:hypothetical protein
MKRAVVVVAAAALLALGACGSRVGGSGGVGGTGGSAGGGGVGGAGGSGGHGGGVDSGSEVNVEAPTEVSAPAESGADVAPDPCAGVPAAGRCVATNQVEYCSVPTGQGTASIVKVMCSSYEHCTVDTKGTASCTPLPSMCSPGATECTGTTTARECDSTGNWVSHACSGCRASAIGALCPGTLSVKGWSGYLNYEARGPNASYTDWATAPVAIVAPEVLVVSLACDVSDNCTPIDATITGGAGDFSVQIQTSPGPNDKIVFWAAYVRPGTNQIAYVVGLPGTSDGEQATSSVDPSTSSIWSWSEVSSTLPASGSPLTITEANFSGAMRVFDWLRYIFATAEKVNGAQGLPLVIWIRPNTNWDCGSCESTVPFTMKTTPPVAFGAQIFIPALAQTTSYYADPVIAHELGHWVMASYGTMPNEGGPHIVNCTTYPGQAWAEGWATWFSSTARTNSLYYDKQCVDLATCSSTVFFWFDIGARSFWDGSPWPRPTPSGVDVEPSAVPGLLQLLDENEVSAMLWSMTAQSSPALTQPGNAAFFSALQSPQVNKTGPYGRAYTRHGWLLGSGCSKTMIVDYGTPAPEFADFLDALVCGGFSTSSVKSATMPSTDYPYPSSAPICK